MRCIHGLCLIIGILWSLLPAGPPPPVHAAPASPTTTSTVTDSMYDANHPRLLFNPGELPSLYNKVRDGGDDDAAYSFIRILIQYIYPGSTQEELLDGNFGLSTIPNLGVGTELESPADETTREMGRSLTVYIADNWDPGTDDYYSSLRLRALSLGYDMFFANSNETERTYIRDEILSYIDYMVTNDAYEVWWYRPYLSNRSAMIGASLGLAAICLDGEADPAVLDTALERSGLIIQTWLNHQVDEEGAYNEGALYAAWSMRNLIYYFWARQRHDGFDYSTDNKIRNMEKWFAYELLPEGGAHVNNIQDCSYLDLPLAQHTTYFDWAQTMWGSGLCAYIWKYLAGSYGHNAGADADKAGTVIWHQGVAVEQPDSVLPPSMLWEDRGLYYYRTGWPAAASSGDVLFSFYSGEFQGGHAQEDQNQFTLYGYGETWAMDHGPGVVSISSESHNMVFIDGYGQHRAGNSIGTDGKIREYLLSGYADYMIGDATGAYTTHSPLNNPGFPFPESDWSWGYGGANPVDHAYRTVIVVRDPATPPYFIIMDDIDKDGLTHTYEWRLHTGRNNVIDTTSNPIHLTRSGSFMDLHVLDPPFSSVDKTITYYNNLEPDPDSNILALSTSAVNPRFCFLLLPGDGTVTPPVVTRTGQTWGSTITVVWPAGKTDVLLINDSSGLISNDVILDTAVQSADGVSSSPVMGKANHLTTAVTTDAALGLLRFEGTILTRYMLTNASTLSAGGINYVTINNGTASIGFSGSTIDIDRAGADFELYAPGVTDMFYRNQRIHVVEHDGFLTRDPVVGVIDDTPALAPLSVRAYPNPFNPNTTVSIDLTNSANVAAVIFDAKGRLIKKLWGGPLNAGVHRFEWNGRNEAGQQVASGVYLAMITTGRDTRTLKLTFIK